MCHPCPASLFFALGKPNGGLYQPLLSIWREDHKSAHQGEKTPCRLRPVQTYICRKEAGSAAHGRAGDANPASPMSVRINPDILVWARETAGLSVEDAAERLSLTTSAKSTAAEKLLALEAGEKEPTKGQLAAAANAYRRPLLTFYMAEPPRTGPKVEDFRQSPDARGLRENAMLDALLRDIRARQETVRDLLQDEDEQGALPLVGSTSIENGVDAAVALLADVLGFDHTDLALRNGDADTLFKRLRTATENAGVFVLVIGDLGSHHSAIPASVFRGFAIADPIAPFVVINAKDARAARSFR